MQGDQRPSRPSLPGHLRDAGGCQEAAPGLGGRDRYALQSELLEWLCGEWKKIEVDWSPELKKGDRN